VTNVAEILGIHSPILAIVARSAAVYLAILAGMRLTGRRQLGQMTPFDLVLILLISNAVQNAMVGPDNSILGGLAAAATLLVLNWVTNIASDRSPDLRKVLEGEPILLVSDGRFIEGHLRLAQLSEDLVMQSVREHGFEKLADIHLAVLEIDGTISVVPAGTHTVRTRHRVRAVRPGGN
jgi:uncharacterized membrane protein YcaP (DUF421 family)